MDGRHKMADQSEYISLQQAAAYLPSRPHLNSVKRWILNGLSVRGSRVRLRAVKAGTSWYTKTTWVDEFLEQTTAAALDAPAEKPDTAAAKRRSAEAGKALEKLGC